MQTVSICDAKVVIHCPCCGTNSLSEAGEVQPCKHLVYVSSSETPDAPWFEKKSRGGGGGGAEEDDDEDDVVDWLQKKFRRAEYVLFCLSEPSPAALEIYVIYRARA